MPSPSRCRPTTSAAQRREILERLARRELSATDAAEQLRALGGE